MDHPTPDQAPGPDDPSAADPVMGGLVEALGRAGHEMATRQVPAAVADRHLAAIHAAATAHAHTAPATATTSWTARVRRVLGLTGAKVALGVGVAAATTGGLAAGGNLPDPAQRVVSDGAAWFGVDLPSPDGTPSESPSATEPTRPEPTDDTPAVPVPTDDAPDVDELVPTVPSPAPVDPPEPDVPSRDDLPPDDPPSPAPTDPADRRAPDDPPGDVREDEDRGDEARRDPRPGATASEEETTSDDAEAPEQASASDEAAPGESTTSEGRPSPSGGGEPGLQASATRSGDSLGPDGP